MYISIKCMLDTAVVYGMVSRFQMYISIKCMLDTAVGSNSP